MLVSSEAAIFLSIFSARLSGTEVDDEDLEKLEDIISSEGKVLIFVVLSI